MQTRAGLSASPTRLAMLHRGRGAAAVGDSDADAFWNGAARRSSRASLPENRALLAKRDDLQHRIDSLVRRASGRRADARSGAARDRLSSSPSRHPFTIGTTNVDPEVATTAGPQLVVPILNARFVLNAANARWGSLYDALYGTDALPGAATARRL